ncbi:bifunctional diaminohydroxyphosphoribosylaminopyrimidine deaminase/5-amino-6-(5-phosphoribosylamino)uracil reductase RibD [Deltaproteobacteria bacterium TL4]
MSDKNDITYMKHAIELGKKVKGKTGDNPYVGCVIVNDTGIIGEGNTCPPGGDHAEIVAMKSAESRQLTVKDATVYSTVEPCSFFGRTPACALTLIEKKVARVVVGIRDPHPKVNGKGIQLLKEAGLEVTEGICAQEIRSYLSDWLASVEETD